MTSSLARLGLKQVGAGRNTGDTMSKFVIGDTVEWTSQSSGFTTTKRGTVVVIVPPKKEAWPLIPKKHSLMSEFWLPRDHESYLVSVPQGGKRKPKVYWPVVSKLKKVEA
jgi:hypothetical protein